MRLEVKLVRANIPGPGRIEAPIWISFQIPAEKLSLILIGYSSGRF